MQFSKRIQCTRLVDSIDREILFLDEDSVIGFLMTDISKAFDCIDHELLIAKMHGYGFDIKSLKFINSYLTGGKQSEKNKLIFY